MDNNIIAFSIKQNLDHIRGMLDKIQESTENKEDTSAVTWATVVIATGEILGVTLALREKAMRNFRGLTTPSEVE